MPRNDTAMKQTLAQTLKLPLKSPFGQSPFKGLLPYKLSSFPAFLANITGFLLLAFTLGLGTAWYAIVSGTPLSTARLGAWDHWEMLGSPLGDPYTKAHMARSGQLPFSPTNALYFEAFRDSEGAALQTSCNYILTGNPLVGDWWTLSLYQGTRLMDNPAGRLSFNSHNIMRRSDGSYQIALSSTVMPGNWYPLTGSGRFHIILRLYNPHVSTQTKSTAQIAQNLPRIKKTDCR